MSNQNPDAITPDALPQLRNSLALSLDRPALSAVAERRITTRLGTVVLRLREASHQVEVTGDLVELTETLATTSTFFSMGLPNRRDELVDTEAGRATYRFESRVDHVDAHVVARRLLALADRPGAVAARAPETATVSALELTEAAGTLSWRAWHLFEPTGELVTTVTTLVPPAVAGAA